MPPSRAAWRAFLLAAVLATCVTLTTLRFYYVGRPDSSSPLPPPTSLALPLSSLGFQADRAYRRVIGPDDLSTYRSELVDFVRTRLSEPDASLTVERLESFFVDDDAACSGRLFCRVSSWIKKFFDRTSSRLRNQKQRPPSSFIPATIFQTARETLDSHKIESWTTHNPEWEYRFFDDRAIDETLARVDAPWDELLGGTRESRVMRADVWRYLILMLEGEPRHALTLVEREGVLIDCSIHLKKKVASTVIQTPSVSNLLTSGGKNLMSWGTSLFCSVVSSSFFPTQTNSNVARQDDEESAPSVIVGIEADVGNRGDWHQVRSTPLSCSSHCKLTSVRIVVRKTGSAGPMDDSRCTRPSDPRRRSQECDRARGELGSERERGGG
jgi:hypothetical protein